VVAGGADLHLREFILRRLQLLQAGDVRLGLFQPLQQGGQAAVDAVDVEGGDAHGGSNGRFAMIVTESSAGCRTPSRLVVKLRLYLPPTSACATLLCGAARCKFTTSTVQILACSRHNHDHHDETMKLTPFAAALAAVFAALAVAPAAQAQNLDRHFLGFKNAGNRFEIATSDGRYLIKPYAPTSSRPASCRARRKASRKRPRTRWC
jgi:hypothetical protein